MLHYRDFRDSPAGRKLADYLADPVVVTRMEAACEQGLPAVAAIDPWAAEALPGLGETERQHAGRMVRDVLAARGWKVGGPNRPKLRNPRLFRSGAVYVRRHRCGTPDSGSDLPLAGDRVARARAILAAGRLDRDRPLDTVDAFLADRRAMWGNS